MRGRWGAVALIVAVSACQPNMRVAGGNAPTAARPKGTVASPTASGQPLQAGTTPGGLAGRVPVSGEIRIPRLALAEGVRLVSDRASGVVGNSGGNIVSNNAGGLTGRYHLAAIDASLVEGARVFLADAAGNPLPGLDSVRTDATGRFEMPQVPAEMTYVVVAEVPTATGKPALFRTLVKVGKLGATTAVDAATTLVTVNVLEGLPGGELGDHNPAKFKAAAQATAEKLTDETLPDFTSLASVKAAMDKLLAEVAELKGMLGEVKSELAAIRQSLDAIKAAQERSPSPAPAPVTPASAPASPSASTAPAPSATASIPASIGPSTAPSRAPSVAPSVAVSPPVAPNPAAACMMAVNLIVFQSNAVGSIEFRLAVNDTPFSTSPTINRIGVGGGSYMGPLPGGCPLWVQYYGFSGMPLGTPFKTTLPPMSIQSPVMLQPPSP